MSNYNYQTLCHHGIKGQKWGIRRYQNEDGSLTAEGKQRYGTVENLEASRAKKKKIAIGVGVTAAAAAAVGAGVYLARKNSSNRKLEDKYIKGQLQKYADATAEEKRLLKVRDAYWRTSGTKERAGAIDNKLDMVRSSKQFVAEAIGQAMDRNIKYDKASYGMAAASSALAAIGGLTITSLNANKQKAGEN